MLNKTIIKSVTESETGFVDARELILHINFNSLVNEELSDLYEYIYELFFQPFKEGFLLNIGTSHRDNIRNDREKLKELFLKELNRGYSNIGYDGIKKTIAVKTKKEWSHWIDKKSYTRTDKYALELQAAKRQKWEKTINNNNSKTINDGNLYFRNILGNILNEECISDDYLDNNVIRDFALNFSACQGEHCKRLILPELTFSVQLYSLSGNIEICADCLKTIMMSFAIKYPIVNAYVTIGDSFAKFASNTMNYFSNYDDGIIVEKNIMYDVDEWLRLNYAEGLEWYNYFAKKIIDKAVDVKELQNNEDIDYIDLGDKGALFGCKKPIEDYHPRIYAMIYQNLSTCLRPGYSDYCIYDVRKRGEAIYFDPTNYLVHGSTVHFRRGKFDFNYLRKY